MALNDPRPDFSALGELTVVSNPDSGHASPSEVMYPGGPQVDGGLLAPGDPIWKRPELLRRHTVEKDGRVHMRLLADQRCSALAGSLGGRVRCGIYHARPSPCRRVQAGSELCLRYRRGHGLEPIDPGRPSRAASSRAGAGRSSPQRAGQGGSDPGKSRAR